VVLGFLFFGRPRPNVPTPTADLETKLGRTTIYHYRSKIPKGKGVIALVHGFCENHLYFQTVAEPLTEAGYDCLGINLFGYCSSIPNESNTHTVEDYARQIVEALQELERLRLIKKLVAVWGHSMGGVAVYQASSEIINGHPEVQGIFLENAGFASNLTLLSRMLKPFAALANFSGPRHLMQPFVNLLFAPAIKDPQAKRFLKMILTDYAPKRNVAVTNLKSISKISFSTETISESALKRMYFIFSKKDKLISFRRVQKSIIKRLRQNPNFKEEQMLILPTADHFVSLQAPEEIAGFVLKHLQAKDSPVLTEAARD
jgi:pimeloyl-ACP methyl ester carboxylesterase